jgi:hypothetical protein
MTHQPSRSDIAEASAPVEHVARLRHVLALIEEISGCIPATSETALGEDARISCAYERAPPILRRRYDALAGETAAWAAAGVKALLRDAVNPPRGAARLLAHDLRKALKRLATLLA